MQYIFIIAVIFLILYLFYFFGFIAVQQKRAMLFSGSLNGSNAKFSACTGKISRIVRFKEEKEYTIRFEKKVDKGSVWISLTDFKGDALIKCSDNESYVFTPVPKKRYKMCIHMDRASGSYRIDIL